jgi:hypothetical protein
MFSREIQENNRSKRIDLGCNGAYFGCSKKYWI